MLSARFIGLAPPHVERKDLEQVGLMALLRAKETWRGKGKFSSYAYTRIRGEMIEELRRGNLGPRENPWEQRPDLEDLQRVIFDYPSHVHASRCIAKLPERQVLATALRIAGYTYEEVGEWMGVSIGTAHSLVQAAIAELKRMNTQ